MSPGLALVLTLALGTSRVTEGVDFVARSEALKTALIREDWAKAAELARALEKDAARRAPLEIVDAQVLAAPPEGLGMYTPAPGGEVRGEELILYAQVRGHGDLEVHGHHTVHLVSDLVITDATGHELARDEAFGESRFTALAWHRDTFVVIALRAKGLPKGDYRARLILHDRIGQKDATREVAFRMP